MKRLVLFAIAACLVLCAGCSLRDKAAQTADNQTVPESDSGSPAQEETNAQTFVLEDWMETPIDSYSIPEEDSALLEELFDTAGLEEAGGPAESPCAYRFIRGNQSFSFDGDRFVDACFDGEEYYWKDLNEEETESLNALIGRYTSQDETPDLMTDCIRIYRVDDFIDTDDPAPVLEITDPDRVWDIISSVDFGKWEEVPPEKEYSAEPTLCVVFNEDAAIVMESTVPEGYGCLCREIRSDSENGGYRIVDSKGLHFFNDGFRETVQSCLNP